MRRGSRAVEVKASATRPDVALSAPGCADRLAVGYVIRRYKAVGRVWS